jgi:hypothetical protein
VRRMLKRCDFHVFVSWVNFVLNHGQTNTESQTFDLAGVQEMQRNGNLGLVCVCRGAPWVPHHHHRSCC